MCITVLCPNCGGRHPILDRSNMMVVGNYDVDLDSNYLFYCPDSQEYLVMSKASVEISQDDIQISEDKIDF